MPVSSNLSDMAKLTDEARRAIATGWNPHVQTMKEYAHSVGVSERAVRKYRARFSAEARQPMPAARAPVPLLEAVDAVLARLAELEAGVDAALAAVATLRATVEAEAARADVPGGTQPVEDVAAPDAQPLPPLPAVPMPPPGMFFWR